MGFYYLIHDNKRFNDIILLEFVICQCSNNAWKCKVVHERSCSKVFKKRIDAAVFIWQWLLNTIGILLFDTW